MLPAGSRLRRREEILAALRQGRRGKGGRPATLLVHLSVGPRPSGPATLTEVDEVSARVGFVVSRAVGPAVVRNRVRRRLRHLAAARLDRLPSGARVVIRALPGAAASSYAELGAALDAALEQAVRPPRSASTDHRVPASGHR